ncbi:hypothetical protein B0T18DRAFT_483862 [Schizothecium vesticola]|uniref:Uncharacterized protein n=1 Tax=Schizothecium vesticola TaxID=314040 RepID=A0AA40KBF8_9PEZI|nr:hypothetical protein B0T18DRAFT_483862 [Schizothecium vesticola]
MPGLSLEKFSISIQAIETMLPFTQLPTLFFRLTRFPLPAPAPAPAQRQAPPNSPDEQPAPNTHHTLPGRKGFLRAAAAAAAPQKASEAASTSAIGNAGADKSISALADSPTKGQKVRGKGEPACSCSTLVESVGLIPKQILGLLNCQSLGTVRAHLNNQNGKTLPSRRTHKL